MSARNLLFQRRLRAKLDSWPENEQRGGRNDTALKKSDKGYLHTYLTFYSLQLQDMRCKLLRQISNSVLELDKVKANIQTAPCHVSVLPEVTY